MSGREQLLELECEEMVEHTSQARLTAALNHQPANQASTNQRQHPAVLLVLAEFVRNTELDNGDVVCVAKLNHAMACHRIKKASLEVSTEHQTRIGEELSDRLQGRSSLRLTTCRESEREEPP